VGWRAAEAVRCCKRICLKGNILFQIYMALKNNPARLGDCVWVAAWAAMAILVPSPSVASEGPAAPLATAAVPVSPKLLRYAERIVRKYDTDQSGDLSLEEVRGMAGKPAAADSNRDGKITVREFAEHAARFGAGRAIRLTRGGDGPLAESESANQPPVSDAAPASTVVRDPRRDLKYFAALPAGVPSWFAERDADGDGQLSLAEYSPKLLKSEIDEFNRHDSNQDGIVTAKELLGSAKDGAPASSEAHKRGEQ
jgi:hypothetical protein